MEPLLVPDFSGWVFEMSAKKTKQQVTDANGFGPRLAELRKQAGYSQQAFADEVGISQRMIAYYETHAAKPPFQFLPRMAEVLGVSVDVLLGDRSAPKKNQTPINRRLLARIRKISGLPKRDQQALMRTVDAFIAKTG